MNDTGPTVNVPALRKVLEHITAHPEEWDQTTWAESSRCGTTMCIAGTAVHQAGYGLMWMGMAPVRAVVVESGHSIHHAAREVLGLSYDQANRLFFTLTSDPRVVWEIASDITGGEIEVPADLPGPAS